MFLHKPSLIVSFSRCVADPQRDDCQQGAETGSDWECLKNMIIQVD